ncbi:MAG: hypothetical protein AAF489_13310 [Bacteroidota bacterium]
MENLNEALGMLAIIIGLVSVVFIIAKYTYLIKKAMIEKGVMNQPNHRRTTYTDIGCIILGLGIGFMVSSIFTEMNLSEDTTDLLVWGTISIFGGLSLLLAHFVRRKLER